jgi:hypothetical protein
VIDERANAKGDDAVADLIERDDPAGDSCRHGGQGILSEADSQGQ